MKLTSALLALFVGIAPHVAFAATPTLLKDINNAVRIFPEFPAFAPVKMGAYWYFNSCTDSAGCELWKTDGVGNTATMVADLVPGGLSGDPRSFVVLQESALYFLANDGTNDLALWKSDGSAAGTTMVRRFGPAPMPPSELTVAGTKIFFALTSGTDDRELWVSDGTYAGTQRVKDINPGSPGSGALPLGSLGSLLLFSATAPGTGTELWRSDGTEAGTFLLKDSYPGANGSFPYRLVTAGPYAYYVVYDGTSVGKLWRTDGSASGTVMIGSIYSTDPVTLSPGLAASGARAFFIGDDGASGRELWITDGTPSGTAMLKDINPGTETSSIDAITPFGSGVLFTAIDATGQRGLWRSDGTSAGTILLKSNVIGIGGDAPYDIVPVGSVAVFPVQEAGVARKLWVTDGTPGGTRVLKDINLQLGPFSSSLLARSASRAFLYADDGKSGPEIWVTDGTEDGTRLVADINPGPGNGPTGGFDPWKSYALGENMMFSFSYPGAESAWISDGTANGTRPLLAPAGQPNSGSGCAPYATQGRLGPVVLFIAFDPFHGCELWRTDGTQAGTFLVKDIHPGPVTSLPDSMTRAAGWNYFFADDGTNGDALWKTDGTEAGTTRVVDGVPPNRILSQFASGIVVAADDKVFYTRPSEFGGYPGIWKTAIGSSLGERVLPPDSPLVSFPYLMGSVGSTVFFSANYGAFGYELWKSDGTAAGTVLVKAPDATSPMNPYFAVSLGPTLLFLSSTQGENQLWRSDGTDAGTVRMTDAAGQPFARVGNLFRVGDAVLFATSQGLWRTDGSPAGARLFKPMQGIYQTAIGAATSPAYFYFSVVSQGNDTQLWRTDGTAEGTIALTPAGQGYWGVPEPASAFGRRLYFIVRGLLGDSLWRTDGDPQSTVRLFGIPTRYDFSPSSQSIVAVPQGVFVFYLHPEVGNEPSFLAVESTIDSDGDGIPDLVEVAENRDALVKDNDVFGNARLFAMQQYRDFLGREGDAAGLNAWTSYLLGSGTRAAMVEGFFASGEFQNYISPVARLYFAYFLRIPDYDGLTFWINYYRTGYALSTIADAFAGSGEFTGRYGALTDDQFVDLVYQNVLGRPADASGKTYWLGQLSSGMTRGTMMLGFSESAEYVAAIRNEVNVTMTYVGMLRRAPDAGGFQFWTGYLDGGNSQQGLIKGFLVAPEYRSRFLP